MTFSTRTIGRWRALGVVLTASTLVLATTAIPASAGTDPAATGTGPVSADAKGSPGSRTAGAILRAGGKTAVKDSYIVVFKDSVVSRTAVAGKARDVATRAGGRIGHQYSHALRGFEITVNEQAARKIAADPSVAYVEQNHTVSIAGTQTPVPSWGLDRIDQRNRPLDNSYTYPVTGSGVRAYVIDTGIHFAHTDFGGRAVSGYDAVDGGSADDANGHGTHVAGTVGGGSYGVAKGVTLVGVRVLDANGSGTWAQVIGGVDWVTADHDPGELAVANMSLGGAGTAVNAAVANSIADGVSYAVAGGNESTDACTRTPASTPTAITVGATDSGDARASFSNYGTCLDIFAPGVSITSAWHTSNTATNTISGTSMASPHVAGAAALVLAQNPSFSPQQVRDALVNDATNGVVGNPGTGSVNKLLYVANTGTPPANDFSVAVSPASGTTPQGGSVATTVVTATTSGSAQAVSLSATGLPAGTTATFVPPSVTSGANSALTIQTSGSTPPGSYPVTVNGSGASGTRTATYTLVVTGTGGCPSPGQKLGNPGFEAGHSVWQMTPDVIGQHAPYQPPRTGSYNAWLLGYGFTTYDILQQTVTLPAGCSSYQLSFWMKISTAEYEGLAFDGIQVQAIVGSTTTPLATWTNLDATPDYVLRTVDLSAFAGQTFLLRFYATEDWSLPTSVVIDDTALTVS
ncbi:S8 family peptidase [Micromonospora sp. NBC_01699]|uniref:S8 family peptidase n=1 Tax=Micromonospora sp. NBC_01699 TaxID=2975984 RepID=UPI002E2BD4F3|nr:S8 family peptidase [Micromonospora sp. NBC_01699]